MKYVAHDQCANSVTVCTPNDGPYATETCSAVVEQVHEIGMVEPGTVQKAVLKTGFVYIRGLAKKKPNLLNRAPTSQHR
jgi:hypothetical protein